MTGWVDMMSRRRPCPWRDAQALCQAEWLDRWGDLRTELREEGRDAVPPPPSWLVRLLWGGAEVVPDG